MANAPRTASRPPGQGPKWGSETPSGLNRRVAGCRTSRNSCVSSPDFVLLHRTAGAVTEWCFRLTPGHFRETYVGTRVVTKIGTQSRKDSLWGRPSESCGEPFLDRGNSIHDQRNVTFLRLEVNLRPGQVRRQPLAVSKRNELVLLPMPDLKRYSNRG